MSLVGLVKHWAAKPQFLEPHNQRCKADGCYLDFPTATLLEIHQTMHDKDYINVLPGLQCLAPGPLLDCIQNATTQPSSGSDFPGFIFRERGIYSSPTGKREVTRHRSIQAVIRKLNSLALIQHDGPITVIHGARVISKQVPTFWQEPSLQALCSQDGTHLSTRECNLHRYLPNAERFSYAIAGHILRALYLRKRPVSCLGGVNSWSTNWLRQTLFLKAYQMHYSPPHPPILIMVPTTVKTHLLAVKLSQWKALPG